MHYHNQNHKTKVFSQDFLQNKSFLNQLKISFKVKL